jgi:hypothetical protein
MVKGAKGAKVNIFFQGLHMIRVIHALVYNLKFYISIRKKIGEFWSFYF